MWQDRTIASSRLRLLEYSAFMEVQRDPDTVTCGLGAGGAVRAAEVPLQCPDPPLARALA